MYCSNCDTTVRDSASISCWSPTFSSMISAKAWKKASFSANLVIRARCPPSTSTFTVPSGRRKSCRMVPRVPMPKMSSATGSLVFAFFCAASRMSLSCDIASSSAAIDFSRPTKRGTTMCGNTMMSRRGSRGTVRTGGLFPAGSFLSSLRKNIGRLPPRMPCLLPGRLPPERSASDRGSQQKIRSRIHRVFKPSRWPLRFPLETREGG